MDARSATAKQYCPSSSTVARHFATIQNKNANSGVGPLFLSVIGAGAPLGDSWRFFLDDDATRSANRSL
jgi:hypothetical protein